MAKSTPAATTQTPTSDFEDGAGATVAFTSLDERYARLPIEQLTPSPHNPRRDFDAVKLAELANSIREKGIVEPLVVRPVDGADDAFEIVAGERRFRAAGLAGLTHVPTLIRKYSDEAVLELVLIENLQREDLAPLEEAAGFKALMVSNPEKHTLTWIATKVGKSEAWVWDRLKLNDLVLEAKTLLTSRRITVGHAILLSRLKPADQERAIDTRRINRFGGSRDGLWQFDSGRLDLAEGDAATSKADPYADLKPVSVREFESWIKTHVRFDVAHAAQAQPLAFEATAAQVTAAESQPGRGKKVVSITHEYRVPDAARDDAERTFGRDAWVRADGQAKSKTCEHSVLGVVVAGAGYGQTLQVCASRATAAACTSARSSRRRRRPRHSAPPGSPALRPRPSRKPRTRGRPRRPRVRRNEGPTPRSSRSVCAPSPSGSPR